MSAMTPPVIHKIGKAERIGQVPREGEHAHAAGIEPPEIFEFSAERLPSLHGEKGTDLLSHPLGKGAKLSASAHLVVGVRKLRGARKALPLPRVDKGREALQGASAREERLLRNMKDTLLFRESVCVQIEIVHPL